MGEETEKTAPEAPATTMEEVVGVNPDVPVSTTTTDKEAVAAGAVGEVEAEKPKGEETGGGGGGVEEEEKITTAFKEESNVVGELPDPEKKALDDLKLLIQEALKNHDFFTTTTTTKPKEEEVKPEALPSDSKTELELTAESETPAAELPPPLPLPPVETKEGEEEEEDSTAAVVVYEDDSGKTVEAIKETIVEVVSAPAPAPAPAPTEEEALIPPPKEEELQEEEEEEKEEDDEEVSIWGIKLLADEEKSDVILLKFLRARDFKVKEAFSMIKNTVLWRKEFGIESLLLLQQQQQQQQQQIEHKEETAATTENIQNDLDKVVFMHGFDKQGHPVCYNVYGEFQNKELYQNTFSDEDKRLKFLRWRIQFLENSIRKLDFTPNGISTIVQINDLKNSPGPFKRELRLATNQALQLLQDNYPEFVAQQVFINVPWWYLAFYKMISPFFTLRTKSKFVFAGPSKSAETLFKYIAPEQVPIQYGGLSREDEQEFTVADPVTEETIKQTTKHTVEFPVTEKCLLVWEVRVVGWEVSYGAEFVPSAEDGYTVIVQKSRKISPADEPIIFNNFKIDGPGKVVLTFDNQTSKKKKLLYRSKTKPSD